MSMRVRSGQEEPAGSPGRVSPRAPERLGPYRLIDLVGEGGMGEVYLALDGHGRAVAIKVLRDHIAYDSQARVRLARELDTLSRVRHHQVAALIDADIDGPRPYLVTRYVAGAALDVVVAERGPLKGEGLVLLGRGLVGAVEAIHAVGVVHRDIKPANVLMEDDADPVLIDFGIAHVTDDIRLTSTGLVMGTPGYLSPEIIDGAPVTEATDWWGWAATVAFAATGRPPFGRGPMEAVLSRVRRGQFDLAGVDPRLEPLLAAALSPRPPERPAPRTIVSALERYAVSAASGPMLRGVPGGEIAGDPPEGVSPTEVVSGRHTEVLPQVEPSAPSGWDWPEGNDPQPYATFAPAAAPPGRMPRVERGVQEAAWPRVPAMEGALGEPDPRIGLPDRKGTLVALVAALGALAAVVPVVAFVLAVAWSWAARVTDRSLTALVLRRYRNGRRGSDVPVAFALGPWHLLSGALATVFCLIVPLLVGGATMWCAALVMAGVTGSSPTPATSIGLAAGALTAVLMAWWGPGGVSLRRGSRSIVRALARPGLAADVAVGLLVALAVGASMWALLRAGVPLWWPLRRAPDILGAIRR